MYKKILTRWLFYLLLSVISMSLSLGAPAEKPRNELKTMYETLVLKCPHLENTELHENFKDIFDNKCTNWTALNDTKNPFSDGGTNAQCLVLYESLLSFCKSFGEKLPIYKRLMPNNTSSINESVDKICNISSFLNNTEHNISDILKPAKCALICGKVSDQGLVVIQDICKLSYFFGTFRTDAFLLDSNSLNTKTGTFNASALLNLTGLLSGVNKPISTQAENSKPAGAPNPQDETHEKSGSVVNEKPGSLVNEKPGPVVNEKPGPVVNEEPAQPDNKLSQVQAAVGAALQDINVANQMPKNEANSIKAEHLSEASLQQKSGESPKKEESKNTIMTSEKKADPKSDIGSPVKSNPDPVIAKPEEGQKEQENQKTAEKPLGSQIKDDVENVADPNSMEEPENGGDGEGDGDFQQDKNEEIDDKGEPKMIKDNDAEPSPEKPATVDIEKASSYNSPEDDMDGDSYFFSYFTVLMCLVVVAYVGYHNRQKILALVLEGKRGKRSGRQGRRPNSANYHKLGSNLEEAISSSCKKDTSNIIY